MRRSASSVASKLPCLCLELSSNCRHVVPFMMASQTTGCPRDSGMIKTLVFFDVEATGLQNPARNERITEISFIGINLDHFMELNKPLEDWDNRRRNSISRINLEEIAPRVMHKLTLCFRPRLQIPFMVSQLTGLDNPTLEHEPCFDQATGELIKGFLHHLPRPACLVAHNGLQFDGPILKAELERVGVDINNFRIVNSLDALKEIYDKEETEAIRGRDLRIANRLVMAGQFDSELDITNEEDDDLGVKPLDPSHSHLLRQDDTKSDDDDLPQAPLATPADQVIRSETVQEPPRLMRKRKYRQIHSLAPDRLVKAKKRLNFNKPPSFNLSRLHEHMFGQAPSQSHGAESDALTLMRICAKKAKPFLQYLDNQTTTFDSLDKMW